MLLTTNFMDMKSLILQNINNPEGLEKLYRTNKTSFRKSFKEVYSEIKGELPAVFWYERLKHDHPVVTQGKDLNLILLLSVIAIFIAKLPAILNIEEDIFYPRNIAFIVLPALTAYFAWKRKMSLTGILFCAVVFILSAVYINLIPSNNNSDVFVLASIHLPLFLWSVMGYSYISDAPFDPQKRMSFLQYNGNLIIMTGLLIIAGGAFSALTLGMFSLINVDIEEFYVNYIIIGGLSMAPLIATWLVQTSPQLVDKIAPVIARIFTPLVLITLTIYLVTVVITGKNPYQDREFLLLFNLMLIAVMAIIVFSFAEISAGASKIFIYQLGLLAVLAIIVNGVALSAIIFRISEWGFTPNRTAVLGGNILILIHLLIVSYHLIKTSFNNQPVSILEKAVTRYLPVYGLWAAIVAFVFPLIF